MSTEEEKFARLPKWAQARIEVLEMRLREANERLSIGPEDSDTFADPYEHQTTKPLGTGALIRFALDGLPAKDCRQHLDARLQDGLLLIRGSDSIRLFPQSSNVVQIQLGRAQYR